jgi:hypothetical protein
MLDCGRASVQYPRTRTGEPHTRPPPSIPEAKGGGVMTTCTFTWVPALNFVLLLATNYWLIFLCVDLRRIERRYEELLNGGRKHEQAL